MKYFINKATFMLALCVLFAVTVFPTQSFASDSLRGKVICVDAGHGGSESGAVGRISYFGGQVEEIYEKDMTLHFANDLKTVLEDEGAIVIMTRKDDKKVSITNRWKLATQKNVDAFISIHFDYIKASPGVLSLYGTSRPQDKNFAEIINNAVAKNTYNNNKGTYEDVKYANEGRLGVLNGGGDYPRVLIEANNNDYIYMQGIDFATESANFAYGVAKGLISYFN
jgi:N-acetylmuramoyl-L-alanine amidase